MDPLFSVKDQVTVITGGSRGLGYTYAKALASRGAKVIICADDKAAIQGAVAELSIYGEVEGYPLDVTKEQQVKDFGDTLIDKYGRIDILINNAGVVQRVAAEEMDEQEWQRVMDVNVTGTFLCCRYLGIHMKKQNKGKIVNISSVAGRKGMEVRLAYCTSKAAIEHFTRTLAQEWGPYKVNVNAIGPGYIKTAMNEDMRADPERYQAMISQVPLGQFGEPEDLVGTLIYLVSPASDYVTGQTIFVEGGLLTK